MSLVTYELVLLNGQATSYKCKIEAGDIFEIPFLTGSNYVITKHQLKTRSIILRSRKLSYRAFFKRKVAHPSQSLLTPKIFRKLPIALNYFNKSVMMDPSLNIFAVLNNDAIRKINYEHSQFTTTVLSLNN